MTNQLSIIDAAQLADRFLADGSIVLETKEARDQVLAAFRAMDGMDDLYDWYWDDEPTWEMDEDGTHGPLGYYMECWPVCSCGYPVGHEGESCEACR